MNPRAIKHLRKSDPVLRRLMDQAGPMNLVPRRLPPYRSLVQSVIYQQLSGKAAATILRRFEALFSSDAFPTPEQVLATDVARLRSAGLSGSKARYVRDIAQKAIEGLVPALDECDQMSDDELVARLTTITGVGRWTVEMFLIFNLGRPDVLPAHDLGVRKGFALAYRKRQLPSPERLERFGERWRPYRTTAAWYLWRATDA